MSKTKEKILLTALSLFNEKGTKAVTTNHIAEACGISPGNLYYHYKNKEEIIRELFYQLDMKWNAENDIFKSSLPPMKLIELQIVKKTMDFFWSYRFIHRELVMLLKKDQKLKNFYEDLHDKRINQIKNIITHFNTIGYIKDLDENTLELLTQIIWLVVLFWQPYLEVGGKDISSTNIGKGTNIIMQLLKPYLVNSENSTDKPSES